MQQVPDEEEQEDTRPRCHVGFTIIGHSLDFDGISATLRQTSAKMRRAGGKTVRGPLEEDIWSIGSPLGFLKPLEEHLQWLRSELEPHVKFLDELSRTAGMKIYIGFTLAQEQNSFEIPTEMIRFFASFNAFIQMYILVNFGDELSTEADAPDSIDQNKQE
jgi:hypothetical protein